MGTARIMTYNIQRCEGVDGEFNPDRVLNVIADAAPDIVALQETGPGRYADPLPYLAQHLGMTVYRDPAGTPAACTHSASITAHTGVCVAGFRITVQPLASAGPSFQQARQVG